MQRTFLFLKRASTLRFTAAGSWQLEIYLFLGRVGVQDFFFVEDFFVCLQETLSCRAQLAVEIYVSVAICVLPGEAGVHCVCRGLLGF